LVERRTVVGIPC